jgi:hypothetical protein
MLDDLTERIYGSRNKLEEFVSQVPGYAGYKAKEERREADRLLREYVARQYEAQLKRLNELQYALTEQGRLREMTVLERAVMRLQLLIDRIKTAPQGYSGVFDAIKVDERVLDYLYEFDEEMLQGTDELAAKLDELSSAVNDESLSVQQANELVAMLERLNNTFSRRQDVILGQS